MERKKENPRGKKTTTEERETITITQINKQKHIEAGMTEPPRQTAGKS